MIRLSATALVILCSITMTLPFVAYGQGAGAVDASQGTYDAPKPGFVPLLPDNDFNKIFGVQNTQGADTDLAKFVQNGFKVALSLGAILAVLRIAWAGYQYMVSDAWGTKSHAKEILANVAIGLLMLLSVYLVLQQINPQLLIIKLHGVTQTPTQGGGTAP